MDERECAHCGRRFTPRKHGHVFCKPWCRHQGVRQPGQAPTDQDAVTRLFDEDRDPLLLVGDDDWHPMIGMENGDEWASLDLSHTVERRRRWFLLLAELGQV